MLKRAIFLFKLMFVYGCSYSQQNEATFHKMLDGMYKNTIPLITVEELKKNDKVVLLDTRELDEFEVSHIKNARYVGYKDFDLKAISDIPKNQTIVLYCSVGYRSERIGEMLKKAGYNNVFNLYGSIFEWVNKGNPVVDLEGKETPKIHTYNSKWSKWVWKGEKVN